MPRPAQYRPPMNPGFCPGKPRWRPREPDEAHTPPLTLPRPRGPEPKRRIRPAAGCRPPRWGGSVCTPGRQPGCLGWLWTRAPTGLNTCGQSLLYATRSARGSTIDPRSATPAGWPTSEPSRLWRDPSHAARGLNRPGKGWRRSMRLIRLSGPPSWLPGAEPPVHWRPASSRSGNWRIPTEPTLPRPI